MAKLLGRLFGPRDASDSAVARSHDDEVEAAATTEGGQLVQFIDRQLKIVGALSERGGAFDFAAMFRGAIMARSQEDNPLHFILAAHGIRELMEKLPSSFNVPKSDPGLKDQVRSLNETWMKVHAHENWTEVDCWTGPCVGLLLHNCGRSSHCHISLETTGVTKLGSFGKFNSTLGTMRRNNFHRAVKVGATAATKLDALSKFATTLGTKSHGNFLSRRFYGQSRRQSVGVLIESEVWPKP
jgi:hypothetical protein